MTDDKQPEPEPPASAGPGTESTAPPDSADSDRQNAHQHKLLLLSLAALGIVYGDIGTSPLYAIRHVFHPDNNVLPTHANVLGILSLIFWSLLLIISVKYLTFVLRADNRGEGGILALTSLVTPVGLPPRGARWGLILLGLFGTALLFGEGIITPAVSVLSAVEGLEEVQSGFAPYVVPITVAIIAGLFLIQKGGTITIGKFFGPVTLVWFLTIAVLGLVQIVKAPSVLLAVSPHHAFNFLTHNGVSSLKVLGAVFLVVTGGEALYADMGHFGRKPIRWAWFVVVLPALALNYFGQGAYLLGLPDGTTDVGSPFYSLAPKSILIGVVVLATAATIIASQALISGAYSLTMQAVQLGYTPRVRIEHKSETLFGQIFIPGVNWTLMIACIGLVLGFGSSEKLLAAYGLAASTTMTITTTLLFFVARERWHWSIPAAALLAGSFLILDITFLAGNALKFTHGGWFPIATGIVIFTLLTSWKRGRLILTERMRERTLPSELFVKGLSTNPPTRVPGTAVFMYRAPGATPPALLHNLKHNKVLHQQVVFLSVLTEDVPHVPPESRPAAKSLGHGLYEIVLRFGFMESVDVPQALASLDVPGLRFSPMETTYFLGRETLIHTRHPGMATWRAKIFTLMLRNERTATSFFRLPPNRVVELGAQIEL